MFYKSLVTVEPQMIFPSRSKQIIDCNERRYDREPLPDQLLDAVAPRTETPAEKAFNDAMDFAANSEE